MGRYLEQTEGRSELQQKIAADLRAKAAARAKDEGTADPYTTTPESVEDSAYLKGTKRTTTLAGAWIVIFFLAIAVFIIFIIQASR